MVIQHTGPWLLWEGVATSMLVAVVVLPAWTADRLDPATLSVFYSCLVVLIVAAVIPWRYVFAQFVTKRGNRWRSSVVDK